MRVLPVRYLPRKERCRLLRLLAPPRLPVRQFLTSGDADQTVSDDGQFRELFVRAILGEEPADANSDGYLTASEIGMYLGDRVTNLTESAQTPPVRQAS